MRADRLVAILMLLQRRGRMSARQLANELEVSTRTIYRDMDALSAAGVPVYSERGAEGGCCLVEDYRTELTGLTPDEAQALSLLTAPGPLDALEVGVDLKAALRKLYAALPQRLAVSPALDQGIYLDWSGGNPSSAPADDLNLLHRALKQQKMVRFAYSLIGVVDIDVTAGPLGLVASEGEWILVYRANDKVSARPVSSLVNLDILQDDFPSPEGFDLQVCWEGLRKTRFTGEMPIPVRAWVKNGVSRFLQAYMLSQAQKPAEPVVRPGWSLHNLSFFNMDAARRALLPLGSAVEVLDPPELRFSLLDYARQVAALYSG